MSQVKIFKKYGESNRIANPGPGWKLSVLREVIQLPRSSRSGAAAPKLMVRAKLDGHQKNELVSGQQMRDGLRKNLLQSQIDKLRIIVDRVEWGLRDENILFFAVLHRKFRVVTQQVKITEFWFFGTGKIEDASDQMPGFGKAIWDKRKGKWDWTQFKKDEVFI